MEALYRDTMILGYREPLYPGYPKPQHPYPLPP